MSQSQESLQLALYNNIHNIFRSLNIGKEILERLKMDMITIKFEANKPVGCVECVFCNMNNSKKKKLHTVRAKSKGNKYFWIISNFKKHLLKIHELQLNGTGFPINDLDKCVDTIQTDAPSSASESNSSTQLVNKPISNIDNNDPLEEKVHGEVYLHESTTLIENNTQIDFDESIQYNTSYNVESTEESILNDEIRPIESSHESLIALETEFDLHFIMYEQITNQLLYMNECATYTKTNGNQSDMGFILEGELCPIKIQPIPKDGNCMFVAIMHQLHGNEKNMEQIITMSTVFRAHIFKYISDNITMFKEILEDRFLEEFPNEPDEEEKSQRIISNLSKNGCWGGYETLIATTMIFNVNILILNEKGSFYYNDPFDMNRKKSILLGYRLSKNSMKRNHYDSVTSIDLNDIYTMTQIKSNPYEIVDLSEDI